MSDAKDELDEENHLCRPIELFHIIFKVSLGISQLFPIYLPLLVLAYYPKRKSNLFIQWMPRAEDGEKLVRCIADNPPRPLPLFEV